MTETNTQMTQNEIAVAMHADLSNDTEYLLLLAVLNGRESRQASRWDTPVCTKCGRADTVKTTSRREVNDTIERHTCTGCGSHGATLIRAGARVSETSTAGDVRTLDLADEANKEYRGTA